MSSEGNIRIDLEIDDADPDELDNATAGVYRELRELEVGFVERVHHDEVPPGAKAVDVASLGAIVVQVSESATALLSVIRALAGWASRRADRSVRVELDGDVLELRAASPAQQQQLIDAWLVRRQNADASS